MVIQSWCNDIVIDARSGDPCASWRSVQIDRCGHDNCKENGELLQVGIVSYTASGRDHFTRVLLDLTLVQSLRSWISYYQSRTARFCYLAPSCTARDFLRFTYLDWINGILSSPPQQSQMPRPRCFNSCPLVTDLVDHGGFMEDPWSVHVSECQSALMCHVNLFDEFDAE